MSVAYNPAVRASRVRTDDALDLYPTPPWATRALCMHVLPALGRPLDMYRMVYDPCAGLGHMSDVLREYTRPTSVIASDVMDYGLGYRIGSWIGEGPDVIAHRAGIGAGDLVCINPPFALADEFVRTALATGADVAALVRSQWLEGVRRHQLFCAHPPVAIAQYAERVPMVRGRWDPAASTATSYCWIVWHQWQRPAQAHPAYLWIPPGCRTTLTRPTDITRFAGRRAPDGEGEG